jgi:MFS family permease
MSSGDSSTRARYRALLGNREYVGLLISGLVSVLGDQLSRVALIVLVYQRTNSPLLSSATYAATFLPVVIGAPLLGGLADRLPRRQVMIAGDLVRALLFALMAVPGLPLWVLLSLLMSAVTVGAPFLAARGSLCREVLGDDDAYQLGSSLDETVYTTGQIVGFAGAGALLVVFTPTTALLLDAVSFVFAAGLVLALVRHRPAPEQEPDPAPAGERRSRRWTRRMRTGLADAGLGFRVAMAPACRRPLLLTWGAVSLQIAPEALAVPWGDQLGAGTLGTGFLFAAGSVGVVVGLLLVGRVSADRGQQLMLPLALLSLVPLLLAPVISSLVLTLVIVFIAGIGGSFSMLARVAFVRGVDNAQRGRAFGIASAGVTAGQGVGIAFAGLAASLTDPALGVALSGALGLVLVTLALLASPPTPELASELDEPVALHNHTPAVEPLPTAPWLSGTDNPAGTVSTRAADDPRSSTSA